MATGNLIRLGELNTRLLLPKGFVPEHGLVVLLHGFGAPGDDLVALAQYLDVPSTVGWVFPEAPIELGGPYGEARAWWRLDRELAQAAMGGAPMDRRAEVPDGLAPARRAVLSMLDALRMQTNVADSRVIIGGFSQGAMLALDVVLQSERAFAGLAFMSGTFLAEAQWAPRMAARAGLPTVMSHGNADPLLAPAASEALRDRLKQAGLNVTWVPFSGGHAIPPQVLTAVGAMITEQLSS